MKKDYTPIYSAVISHDLFSIKIWGEGLKFSKYAFVNSVGPDFKKGDEIVLIKNSFGALMWYKKLKDSNYLNIECNDYPGLPDNQAYGLIEDIKVL
jgi:hypothetical protein